MYVCVYQPINNKYMLVLANLCVNVSAWIYVSVYKNQHYCNRQKFYSKWRLWSEKMRKKCFLKPNKIFEVKVNGFCFFWSEKKVFSLFASKRYLNNLVKVKRKIGNEKKQKEARKFKGTRLDWPESGIVG